MEHESDRLQDLEAILNQSHMVDMVDIVRISNVNMGVEGFNYGRTSLHYNYLGRQATR